MSRPTVPNSLLDKGPHQVFSIQRALVSICFGASSRVLAAASNVRNAMLAAVLFVPRASADYPYLNSSDPIYDGFVASSSNDSTVAADVNNFMAESIGLKEWQSRVNQIRSGGSKALCIGNLSIALSELGVCIHIYIFFGNGFLHSNIWLVVKCPSFADQAILTERCSRRHTLQVRVEPRPS